MIRPKEELIGKIEEARKVLNKSIEEDAVYEEICTKSRIVDFWIEQYIAAGY